MPQSYLFGQGADIDSRLPERLPTDCFNYIMPDGIRINLNLRSHLCFFPIANSETKYRCRLIRELVFGLSDNRRVVEFDSCLCFVRPAAAGTNIHRPTYQISGTTARRARSTLKPPPATSCGHPLPRRRSTPLGQWSLSRLPNSAASSSSYSSSNRLC